MVANIGRDDLRTRLDGGDPVILLEVLAPQYYRHSHLPGALNLPPGKVAEMAPDLLPDKVAGVVLHCWNPAVELWEHPKPERVRLRVAERILILGRLPPAPPTVYAKPHVKATGELQSGG